MFINLAFLLAELNIESGHAVARQATGHGIKVVAL